ncbi:GPI anchored cell wall protein [Blastomyces dermatitidis ER-3]|uniref:GPI anchored cell wall protein n=1 Tax=Ajellomyces dermatitidis (strain ER-3 / ATCC MYA-2586) TaxID=559297 RepID=A0ABP2F382_AJEDR|nr:GPI anchored cell wall protein [Blastomyces dermatitidis ER-3]EEQ91341.2 GPI anchored cell wall protein [Blastomyces dermatitidis ER-3]
MKPIYALSLLILSATGQNYKSCSSYLNGSFEFPHLIIPVDSAAPTYAPGTSFFGQVTSTISSIFNFDFSPSSQGRTCSLWFLFPKLDNYSFSGDGRVGFSRLAAPAALYTIYANSPPIQEQLPYVTLVPRSQYLLTSFECPAGQAIAFRMDNWGTTYLKYFQDYNPPAIGLYITIC